MNTRQIFLTTICAAALANTAVGGPHQMKLSEWDADGNKSISLQEWETGIEEHDVFENIDENNNGVFDIEEAVESVVQYDLSMDIDDGGVIDRHEFALGTFNNLDENDDDRLDNDEFAEFSNDLANSNLLSSN